MNVHPMDRVPTALRRESEIIARKTGAGGVRLIRAEVMAYDTVVILYMCDPVIEHRITEQRARYRTDIRLATYVRGRRAASVNVWSDYFDIVDMPPSVALLTRQYWGDDQ
jgi:hypothetical protein